MPSKTFGQQRPEIPHLSDGEVKDLRTDVEAAFAQLESQGGLFRTEEFVDPAAADTDFFVTARASAAAEDTIDENAAEWQTVSELVPPRNITITSSTHADIDAVAVVLTGKVRDINGKLIDQTDTITLTDGGGATDAGTKAFSTFISAVVPAQSGTGGTIAFGFGDVIGLAAPIKTRAGLTAPIREIEAGSVVTTGTFTTTAAQGPHGTYAPATVPDASNDYAITYEVEG